MTAPSIIITFPGFPFTNLASAATFAALRALVSTAFVDGQDIAVDAGTVAGDGFGGLFNWNAASVAVDDGATIIKPTDKTGGQAGRWLASGSGTVWLETGTGAVARTIDALLREQAISVIDFIPANLRAAIVANTGTTELVSYFNAASTACVAQNRALYVPRGTYAMQTWSPPANLTVVTDGRKTIFKQLDTGGVGKRIIVVAVDGVSLWEGGSATLDGSIDTIPGNATEQNHGIIVDAPAATTINRFTVGDCYGKNIGGDVLTTYSPGGTIGHCEIGTLYGTNIYRNIVSITGGKSGRIAGVIQEAGGAGLGALNFEPDPANTSAPSQWEVGIVRGRTVTFAGDPGVRLGEIKIGILHLDYSVFGVSTPPYNTGGINVGSSPDQFLNGIRCRNWRTLHIGQAFIKGHPRSALLDLGTGAGDDLCDSFHFGSLILEGIGTGGYPAYANGEIVLQKQRKFSVGVLVSIAKVNAANPTFLGGADCALIEVQGGEIQGRVCNGQVGAILFENVKQTSLVGENIFRFVDGKIRLRGGSGAGVPAAMFQGCPIAPVVEDWTGDSVIITGTTPNVRLVRSTVNALYYDDAWSVATAAIASAAALTLTKAGDVIPVSGTTTITSITADAGNRGRTVTLVPQGILTFTDGGNLVLAGNFVTTADDTITLATADGTTYYEICRSVN